MSGKEGGCFRKVAGMSFVDAAGLCSRSSSVEKGKGWGLMRGITIPQQEFTLKMQGGGLCARGGVFAGYYGKWFKNFPQTISKVGISHLVPLPLLF